MSLEKLQDKILSPFLVYYGDSSVKLLVPYVRNGEYALTSINLKSDGATETPWTFTIRRIKGENYVDLSPSIKLFTDLSTPSKWRTRFTKCSPEQVQVIIDWMTKMNKEKRKRRYGL